MAPRRQWTVPPLLILLGGLLVWGARAQAGTGDPDPTFGTGGVVVDDFGVGTTGARRLVIQPDGGIVAVGSTYLSGWNDDLAVVRLLPDGSPDPTFGTAGHVTIDFGSALDWYTTGLALQPDGKLLVGGYVRPPFSSAPLVRLLPDGTMDPGFGVNGLVEVPCLVDANIDLLPDGRIMIAGESSGSCAGAGILVTVRLLPDGSLDPAWGGTGVVHSLGFGFGSVAGIAVDAADRVLVAGRYNVPSGAGLVRFLADGTLDPAFGLGGVVQVPDAYMFGSVAVQPDGRIAVVAFDITHFQELFGTAEQLAVVRFDDTGALDAGFGQGGSFEARLGAVVSEGSRIRLDDEGRLLVGVDGWVNFATRGGGMARLTTDGRLDPLFGTGGWTLTGGAGSADLAIQSDGKVVTAGGDGVLGGAFTIARYTTDCPAAPDGDGDGIGDACDPCTGDAPFETVAVRVRRLLPPDGDETLRVSGSFTLAGPLPDLIASGLRLRVEAEDGATIVDAVVPPGVFDPDVQVGWKVNAAATTFKYGHRYDDLPPPTGITKAAVKALATPNQYKFKIVGRGSYAATAASMPLTATLALKPPRGEGGECAVVRFADPPLAACKVNASESSMVCR